MALNFELKLSMQSIDFLIALSRMKDQSREEWKKLPHSQMFIVQSRILQREGLILVTPLSDKERKAGAMSNRWEVTPKGQLLIQYLTLEFKELQEGRMLTAKEPKRLRAKA